MNVPTNWLHKEPISLRLRHPPKHPEKIGIPNLNGIGTGTLPNRNLFPEFGHEGLSRVNYVLVAQLRIGHCRSQRTTDTIDASGCLYDATLPKIQQNIFKKISSILKLAIIDWMEPNLLTVEYKQQGKLYKRHVHSQLIEKFVSPAPSGVTFV